MGILNLDKPAGLSSAQALTRLKHSSGEFRLGHAGTLDPLATGVLPVLFGRATVLASLLSGGDKTYVATVCFGASSPTDDSEGPITDAASPEGLNANLVATALALFEGEIEQIPPAYSAIHVAGRRSYEAARTAVAQGKNPEAPPARRVHATRLSLMEYKAHDAQPMATLEITCGPGFYVRSLARDLGSSLGTRAYLASLARTSVAGLSIADAIGLDEAEAAGPDLLSRLLPANLALAGVTCVQVDESGVGELGHGRAVAAGGQPEGEAWAAGHGGRVLAIGEVREALFHPHRLVELA